MLHTHDKGEVYKLQLRLDEETRRGQGMYLDDVVDLTWHIAGCIDEIARVCIDTSIDEGETFTKSTSRRRIIEVAAEWLNRMETKRRQSRKQINLEWTEWVAEQAQEEDESIGGFSCSVYYIFIEHAISSREEIATFLAAIHPKEASMARIRHEYSFQSIQDA